MPKKTDSKKCRGDPLGENFFRKKSLAVQKKMKGVVYIIVFDTSAKAQAWLGLIAHSLASLSCSLFNLPHLLHHSLRFAPLMVTFALMSNTIIYTTPLRFAPSLNCSPFKLISNPPFYTTSYYSNSKTLTITLTLKFTLHPRDTYNIIQITSLFIECR